MDSEFEIALLAIAGLLLLGVLASKVSYKLGVPSLLLFLVIGMLAGSEGIGGIEFSDYNAAQNIGTVALAYILFAGGFDTQWSLIRPTLGQGISLATVGVALTGVIVGLAATALLDLTLMEALLLGAIVSSTDAPAVFSILRSRSLRLSGRLKPLLELESGSNDPMAVLMTLIFISLITGVGVGAGDIVLFFFLQLGVGAAIGFGGGKLLVFALNRLRLEYGGLYPVVTMSAVLAIYAGAASLNGSGFLAVYLAGLIVGKSIFVYKRSLMRFHDGVTWAMQIGMFLTLGLLVFPSDLPPVMGMGLVLALLLIFVARPLAVFISLHFFKVPWRHKAFISWMGLKGAVPIIIATFPLLEGVHNADIMFNIVFFVVITSVLIQGTTIPLVARLFRVDESNRPQTEEDDAQARSDAWRDDGSDD